MIQTALRAGFFGGRLLASWAFLCLLCPAAAGSSEIPILAEAIDVRVVNVDVVVTDKQGRPVTGLQRSDFVLEVDGTPTEVRYFSAYEGEAGGMAPKSSLAVPEVAPDNALLGAGSPREELPLLVILLDSRSLLPGEGRRALEELKEHAETLTRSSRGVMVARHGRSLRLGQRFTRDPEEVRAALDQLKSNVSPMGDAGGRELILRRLEMADAAGRTGDSFADLIGSTRIEAQAISFLTDIRGQAEVERHSAEQLFGQLKTFVRALSGLAGRKAILYLGPGFQLRPGEVLYRLWWQKYGTVSRDIGVDSIESEIAKHKLQESLVSLIAVANSHRVSFYTFDPLGVRNIDFSAKFTTLSSTLLTSEESRRAQAALISVATGTGGIGRANASSVAAFVDEMAAGFGSFYSLGFEPEVRQSRGARRGRIKVRLPGSNHRLRYLARFASRTPAEELEERALATLLTDVEDNPLAVNIELEKPERQKDGSYLLPMLVKVPISRLALLPHEERHIGKLSFVILAQADSGDLSAPTRGEVPLEIRNQELLGAMNTVAGYRVRLRVNGEQQKLAVCVRDEVTGTDSMVNLVIDPPRGL